MADLNELSQFEKELRNLIESRNNFTPQYTNNSTFTENQNTFKNSYEEEIKKTNPELESLKNYNVTLMGVSEHGKPFTQNYPEKVTIMTFMGVKEHGQPFKATTNMAIKEHGNPFKSISNFFNMSKTEMLIKEHGQPFAQNESKMELIMDMGKGPFIKKTEKDKISYIATRMAIREHGKPYNYK